MVAIDRLRVLDEESMESLSSILQEAVNAGSPLGFIPPITAEECRLYWRGIAAELSRGKLILLVARNEQGAIVGTMQVALHDAPAGRHRAELEKFIVHSNHRKFGVAQKLATRSLAAAREEGRSLIICKAEAGSPTEEFYRWLGGKQGGLIPAYFRMPDGSMQDVSIFYKELV
jgi:acetyltransferase